MSMSMSARIASVDSADSTMSLQAIKTKIFYFLDGTSITVPETACRGCYMEQFERELSPLISPVYEDESIVIRQDAEWPIPGFFIVSSKEHVASIADIEMELAGKIGHALHFVRLGLRKLFNIERAHIYHEEKIIAPHMHFWILPLWPDIMQREHIAPKIYEANVKDYLHAFTFTEYKDSIRDANYAMRQFLDIHLATSNK
ncbi:MAG TPA: hypothetical protein VGZ00_07295 [Candidatus Baltobacteraceae bacterium]|nr:hypothetical protein [Candidatus Baltobacteraceae bacterium]